MAALKRQKLNLIFKSFLIGLLFLGGLQVFSQDDHSEYSDDGSYREEERPRHKKNNYDDLDAEVESAIRDSQNLANELQGNLSEEDKKKLNKAIKEGDNETVKELTLKMSKGLNAEQMDKLVKSSLGALQSQSKPQLRAQFQERFKATFLGPVIEKFPKVLDFIVNIVKDPLALPELFRIPADRTRLLYFLGCNVALFLLAKMIKRGMKGKNPIKRWFIFSSLRFATLLFFFHRELGPSWMVFKRTFL